MSTGLDDLRCKVLGRSTEGVGAIALLDALLRQAEVRDAYVALAIEDDVLRLEVSVDDVTLVQGSDGVDHLSGVELGAVLRESLLAAEISEQFATVEKVNEEVQLGFRLEGKVQADNVRVLDLF